MFSRNQTTPVYLLHGLGQTPTVQDWISGVLQPIADTVKKYIEAQTQPMTLTPSQIAQQTAATTSLSSLNLSSISPIYLIAGGILVWFLFRGQGVKGTEKRRRR